MNKIPCTMVDLRKAPTWTLTVLLLALVGCDSALQSTLAPASAAGAASPVSDAYVFGQADLAAAEAITADRMRRVIAELASDRYEGRAPGSAGDQLTQRFLSAELQGLGLQPGGDDGGWLQRVPLVGLKSESPAQWSFHGSATSADLARGTDFIAVSGVQAASASLVDAELVFVGYGIEAPEYQWDDFKGSDLRGKVLVMLNNDPDWDEALFAGTTRLYYGRWSYKYESAARQGAAGAIIIHTPASAGYPWQVVQTSWGGEQFQLQAGDEPRLQVSAWVTEAAAARLLTLAGHDLAALQAQARDRNFRPVPLGLTTSLQLTNTLSRQESANVIGVLPGSDPALAHEVVVFTAHHDHLGLVPAETPGEDRVYNGALDNASGVAQVLAMASAFTALPEPPRRSIMFNFVAAEEQGLLGSRYYAEHPTYAPGRIAANINVDGVAIWGRSRDLTLIGFGKSSLDAVVTEVARLQGRVVTDDQFPDRGSFYRSDQFNFAKIGVPAVYADTGTDILGQPPGWGADRINHYNDVDYHQPSDELTADWNFEGAVEDGQLLFLVGLRVANETALPRWKAGDEFEAVRLRALQAP